MLPLSTVSAIVMWWRPLALAMLCLALGVLGWRYREAEGRLAQARQAAAVALTEADRAERVALALSDSLEGARRLVASRDSAFRVISRHSGRRIVYVPQRIVDSMRPSGPPDTVFTPLPLDSIPEYQAVLGAAEAQRVALQRVITLEQARSHALQEANTALRREVLALSIPPRRFRTVATHVVTGVAGAAIGQSVGGRRGLLLGALAGATIVRF